MLSNAWNRPCAAALAALLLGWSAAAAHEVTYRIHEAPEDPDSPVAFELTLRLEAAAVDGHEVGWSVAEIELTHHAAGSAATWLDAAPALATPDGLWWVSHEDVNAPRTEEFAAPPQLAGVAGDPAGTDPDLLYEIAGSDYTPPPPPDVAPYFNTGAMSWTLWLAGLPEPLEEGDDEPVDIPPDNDPV